jgi:hypothetical protein
MKKCEELLNSMVFQQWEKMARKVADSGVSAMGRRAKQLLDNVVSVNEENVKGC